MSGTGSVRGSGTWRPGSEYLENGDMAVGLGIEVPKRKSSLSRTFSTTKTFL